MAKLPYYIERRLDSLWKVLQFHPGFPRVFQRITSPIHRCHKIYRFQRGAALFLFDAKRPAAERYLRAHTSDFASCHPPWLGFSCLSPYRSSFSSLRFGGRSWGVHGSPLRWDGFLFVWINQSQKQHLENGMTISSNTFPSFFPCLCQIPF